MRKATQDEIKIVLSEFSNADTVDLRTCSISREIIDRVEAAGLITVDDTDIGMAFMSEMHLTDTGRGRLGRTSVKDDMKSPWPFVLGLYRP